VVSYGGKTIPRWRTAAILKIDISPYLSEKSSDFHDVIKQELSYHKQLDRASAAHTIRRGHLRDLEIYVKGHSRSLETETLDRSYTTYC